LPLCALALSVLRVAVGIGEHDVDLDRRHPDIARPICGFFKPFDEAPRSPVGERFRFFVFCGKWALGRVQFAHARPRDIAGMVTGPVMASRDRPSHVYRKYS
jgi:hypothetical protein